MQKRIVFVVTSALIIGVGFTVADYLEAKGQMWYDNYQAEQRKKRRESDSTGDDNNETK